MTGLDDILAEIDWTRMAVPQPDGYDTQIILRLATTGNPPLRRIMTATRWPSRLGDSTVAVAPALERGLVSETIVPAALDHPNLAMADLYLRRWPEAHGQFQSLIEAVHPYTDIVQAAQGDWSLGSSSYSYDAEWGRLHVTVDDALGLAQALIHETAHQKLAALGVEPQRATRLILNEASELYRHPHFKRHPQPMATVLHEQYTFIHVTALDLHMLRGASSDLEKQRILMLLARNVNRMEVGHEDLMKNIITDQQGRLFIDSFIGWSNEVIRTGRSELENNGYGFE